ncbi:MAG: DUF2062 domain-containing protein [Terrimicrobiaceae bacterium]
MNEPKHWRRSKVGPLLRRFPRIKHMRGTWLHRTCGDKLFGPEVWRLDPHRLAAGAALGAFFAMIPVPFQMLGAGLLAVLTRVNLPAALVATWVSNPLTLPIFLWLQYRTGSFLLGKAGMEMPDGGFVEVISKSPFPILVGASVFAFFGALIAYPLTLWGWSMISPVLAARKKKKSLVIEQP